MNYRQDSTRSLAGPDAGSGYLARLLVGLIRVYQWTLAPLLGNCCRFEPSCSRYAMACIRDVGPMRGCWLALTRVCRCHPFNAGGYDPPPKRAS